MVDRDWERELADIVSRPEPGPAVATAPADRAVAGPAAVDLRDEVVADAPSSDELAAWVERLGASLLRLVDRRLADLGDDLAAEVAELDTRIDVLIEVVQVLAAQVAALVRTVERTR